MRNPCAKHAETRIGYVTSWSTGCTSKMVYSQQLRTCTNTREIHVEVNTTNYLWCISAALLRNTNWTLHSSPGKLQLVTSKFYFVKTKIWPQKAKIGRPNFGKSLQGLPQRADLSVEYVYSCNHWVVLKEDPQGELTFWCHLNVDGSQDLRVSGAWPLSHKDFDWFRLSNWLKTNPLGAFTHPSAESDSKRNKRNVSGLTV